MKKHGRKLVADSVFVRTLITLAGTAFFITDFLLGCSESDDEGEL